MYTINWNVLPHIHDVYQSIRSRCAEPKFNRFHQLMSNKEKILFRSQRKAVNAGANGTLEYTIKEGVNKQKIADNQLIKNKK